MKFSIVIPTYNRVKYLEKLINSIQELEYDKTGYEVVIVDDGSTDNTINLIQRYSSFLCMKYCWQTNSGPSSARNRGIDLSDGEYICFLDDDCKPPKDWLRKIDSLLSKNLIYGICGKSTDTVNTVFSVTSQFISNFLLENLNEYYRKPVFIMSNNVIYKKEIFDKIDKFNLQFKKPGGEDRELNLRIINEGYKIIFSNEITIEHNHRLGFNSFLKQQFNYGIGSYLLHRIQKKSYPDRYSTPISLYFKMILVIIKNFNFPQNFVILLLFFISQFLIILGMIYKKVLFQKITYQSFSLFQY
jgi:glycosyltransferase involved in cell wall biosynthesis